MSRLVITRLEWEKRNRLIYAQFDSEQKLENFQVFEEEEASLLDHIYIGRVDSISANIRAAFVKFGPELMGFLPLQSAEHPIYTKKLSKSPDLKQGDEILVQVNKDAVKTKLPVLTAHISMSGNYCILNTDNPHMGVSKKIPSDQAQELRDSLKDMFPEYEQEGFGLLLRTNAATAAREILEDDLQATVNAFRKCMQTACHKQVYSCVWRPAPSWIQKLKGVRLAELEAILTDQEDVYDSIANAFPSLLSDQTLRMYRDPSYALSALYGLRAHLEKLTSRRVWLNSGANIIIEQLETLTFIDVNTARNQSHKVGVELDVNMEAAKEITRQIRMRNLSGMIIIDFINMETEEEQAQLIRFLRQELKQDSIPCSFVDITKLGLVELTRKKVFKSLKEVLL